eukprot:scaffold13913_cov84-Skeletonema_dohrnii-CCMP3373.AAC.2
MESLHSALCLWSFSHPTVHHAVALISHGRSTHIILQEFPVDCSSWAVMSGARESSWLLARWSIQCQYQKALVPT